MALPNYAEVAVFRPIRRTFEYSIPGGLKKETSVGSVCRLPFRGETVRGLVLDLNEEPSYEGEQKKLKEIITGEPLSEEIIGLARWLSYTTLTPIGQVLNRFVPADLSVRPRTEDRVELRASFEEISEFLELQERRAPKQVELVEYLLTADETVEKNELLRETDSSRSPLEALKEKGLVEITPLPEIRSPEGGLSGEVPSFQPRSRKSSAFSELKSGRFRQYTVNGPADQRLADYLELTEKLSDGGTVIIMAPNVIRAEELTELVRKRLNLVTFSYHSDLTRGEISYRWNLATTGEPDVFVGVLSAIYLSVPRLSAVIVEGDGERNYELVDRDPKGNAIETARKRAELEGVPLVIGGTGPSVRSYNGVNSGEIEELRSGFSGGFGKSVNLSLESPPSGSGARAVGSGLMKAIKRNYRENQSVVIIGGKKGSSGAAVCEECGEIVRCSDCEVPLTFTGTGNYGVCPYCGFRQNLVVCDNCGSDELNFIGSGLETAESEIRSVIPGAEVIRFDSQEDSWEDFLETAAEVLNGQVDVLLGTKLVASLFFHGRISLVGMLDLDLVTNRPSYRSTEYLIQRVLAGLDMVKGGGELFLQTGDSGGSPFDFIMNGELEELYESELKSRQRMGYPPFRDLLKIEVEGGEEAEARDVAMRLKRELTSGGANFDLLGPVDNKFGTRKGRYRSDLVVKAEDGADFLERIHSIVSKDDYREVRINPFA